MLFVQLKSLLQSKHCLNCRIFNMNTNFSMLAMQPNHFHMLFQINTMFHIKFPCSNSAWDQYKEGKVIKRACSIPSNAVVSYQIYIVTLMVEKCDCFTGSGTTDSANDQSKQPRIAREIIEWVIFAQQIKMFHKRFCMGLDRLEWNWIDWCYHMRGT